MSNTILTTLATTVLAIDRAAAQRILAENPLVGFVFVSYTYTREYGSDGCWDSTEKGACLLSEWVNGRYMDKHPGNRSYNFRFSGVEETDLATVQARRDEQDAKRALQVAAVEAAAAASRAASERAEVYFANVKAQFMGKNVTSKKASGKVERVMRSQYSAGAIVALVAGKWVNTDKLTLA